MSGPASISGTNVNVSPERCCEDHADSPQGTGHAHGKRKLIELTEQLRAKSRKITGPRQKILDVFRNNRHPVTIKEVFARMPKGDCDLVTVYRSVHLLEGMGMVKRFDFGDGVARFELVDGLDGGHHHHLVCTRCDKIVELEDCFAQEMEQAVAARNGFKSVTHKLEFFGVCPKCQTTP